MKFLFVHNNFPAQFRNVAVALGRDPDNQLAAIGAEHSSPVPNVDLRRYHMPAYDVTATHPFARRFDIECRRAEQVLFAASALAASGFTPDLVFAHCGWGENIPLRTAFPEARLVIYCEYFYRSEGQDVHFDLEQGRFGIDGLTALHCGNASTLIALAECDMGISPTKWQRSTYPKELQEKIQVVHEGVDLRKIRPDPFAQFVLPGGRKLTRDTEVVTFISRSLEPMRGFHKFLRAAPEILRARPDAEIVIVGGEKPSYGPGAPDGGNWKTYCLNEMLPELDFSRVHFLDRLPYERYLALLQLSSVHIYLTYPFVLSWSLIEAMAAGCTIVASDTAPVREVIEDGRNGLLVPFHDSGAVAEAVIAVLSDPSRYGNLGRAARQTAAERYDATVCVPEALRLLGVPQRYTMASDVGDRRELHPSPS
jgi:glycosyltransferase involved in cell wall biosynthesis